MGVSIMATAWFGRGGPPRRKRLVRSSSAENNLDGVTGSLLFGCACGGEGGSPMAAVLLPDGDVLAMSVGTVLAE
jgi:hypothetical protein